MNKKYIEEGEEDEEKEKWIFLISMNYYLFLNFQIYIRNLCYLYLVFNDNSNYNLKIYV